jgi:hypothetical protein
VEDFVCVRRRFWSEYRASREINSQNKKEAVMKKTAYNSLAVGIGMLAIAGLSQAQGLPSSPGTTGAPIEKQAGATNHANGEVTSVDAKDGKLTVKTSKEELSLEVQGSSAKQSLADIKVGDKVNVSFQDKGGMMVATSVQKASAGSEAGKASSSKEDMGSPSSKTK